MYTWMDWAIWVRNAEGSLRSFTVRFANKLTSESGSVNIKRNMIELLEEIHDGDVDQSSCQITYFYDTL